MRQARASHAGPHGVALGQIWLVLSPSETPFEQQALQTVRRFADDRGLAVHVRRTEKRRFSKVDSGSRPLLVLKPADAHELYRELHRGPCYVISRGAVRVLLDPRRDPPSVRSSARLSDYVRHKAVFRTLEDGRDLRGDLSSMLDEVPSDCPDANDPRVLPLQTFEKPDDEGLLATASGREGFRTRFGAGAGSWRSPELSWRAALPGARHGRVGPSRAALRVWSTALPVGHHWDVAPHRGSAKQVFTAGSVWKIRPSGYVNVYADAYVRQGERCSEVWTAQR
jgi:hypothetical protein